MKRLILSVILLQLFFFATGQPVFYVAVNGNDDNAGSLSKPLKTLETAVAKAKSATDKNVLIALRGGIYPLSKTIELSAKDLLFNSLTIRGYLQEKVIITGSKEINPQWQPFKDGILKASLNETEIPDQLFLNDNSLHMARYPNYDATARVFNGTAADAISNERVSGWKNPAGGFIHALHQGEWGDFHYQITGKDDSGKLVYIGGWQNNRPAPMHKEHRFVENIFEELDAPGEWYFDNNSKTLYLYPPRGTDLKNAVITISVLTDLIHVSGTMYKPAKNISIQNISFTQTARSFMLVKEPLLRSDWTIYRGGAILLDGCENITISNCNFYELGGNAVFVSNYNKQDTIRDNHIYNIGGNAIAFVGSAHAVRSPAFRYEKFVPWNEMDYTKGSKTNNYPQYCKAIGNLIHSIGNIEKQVAGIQISMATHITASHNTIYAVPRAGINVSEGTWGGHLIEFNDVFNTVLETGDHGAFNSWGRDRYWRPERNIIDSIVAAKTGIELLDVVDPIIIRNNRFQCDHGWDIDLDDGSTNYQIYNNVCLNGGLKLREGYHRTVTNNILVNNTFHPHVWLKNNDDVFMHNIITTPYAPIQINDWGTKVDSNFFLAKEGLAKAQALGLDKQSMYGDAQFVNPISGDYHLKTRSPATKMGFKNFDMNVGVTLPSLKKLAEKPTIKPLLSKLNKVNGIEVDWLGATFKNIETLGERSAAGLHDDHGALLAQLPAGSLAAKSGLQKGDVIVKLDELEVKSISDLLKIYQGIKWMGRTHATVIRNQLTQAVILFFK
ncbi:PDZ domain-containing protein [soil metagenome]